MVPKVGLEPTRANSPDFESGASTNSATQAQRNRGGVNCTLFAKAARPVWARTPVPSRQVDPDLPKIVEFFAVGPIGILHRRFNLVGSAQPLLQLTKRTAEYHVKREIGLLYK